MFATMMRWLTGESRQRTGTGSIAPVNKLADLVRGVAVPEGAAGNSAAADRLSILVANLHEPSRDLLEQLALRYGTTLVRIAPSYVKEMFSTLSDDLLLDFAQAMAVLAPLKPVPRWRFGDFVHSPELAVHIRHSLWQNAKLRGLRRPIIVPWHGYTRLELHLDNDLSLTFLPTGSFEPNEFALMDRLLQPGMVFVDGGANEGFYTVFASSKVGSEGRVIAVEPSPRELVRLRANLRLNNLRNVDVAEMALVERPGRVRIRVAEARHSGQNTLGNFAYEGIETTETRDVVATTLDDLLAQSRVDAVDVIKFDLEGAEIRALGGALLAIRRSHPLLMIEVSPVSLGYQGGSPEALLTLLRQEGYVILTIDDETGEPVPARSPVSSLLGNIVAVHHQRTWGFTV